MRKGAFTLVLMSMLRLGDVKFLHGCRGLSLDYAAREPLWRRGLNYEHGTGHGVSYLSSVHERPKWNPLQNGSGAPGQCGDGSGYDYIG